MAEIDKDDLISIIEEEHDVEDVPETLPLMPVRDVVIFTDMLLPLFIGRERSIYAVDKALSSNRYLMLATQKDPGSEDPEPDEIYKVGTVGRILRMLKLPDGRMKTLVQGICKARILEYLPDKGPLMVRIERMEEKEVEELSMETEALIRTVRDQSEKIMAFRGELTGDVGTILDSIEDPGRLADLVGSNLRLKLSEAQELLEIEDPVARLRRVSDLLIREVELSAMQAKIHSDVRDEISKTQRDFFLREQVRAIHKELGEADERTQEVEEYKKRIKKAKMPKPAQEEATKQLRRMEQMHPDSSETAVVRTYLDWLLDMPWSKITKDVLEIKKAQKLLDKEHFGLERVKERILDYLSVRKLNPTMKGPILCFLGPPGVGKTSLGRAIASAMGRKFYRLSLGGIRDEAEIRGHRRTYIGAMPGRILQGLKQCGSKNPVFMMDEIDKIGSDYRGDPSSALLEALDPEQNAEFSDHYLNLSFDLSGVMFILTANITDTIPSALLDRMEIIEIPGYTPEEKLEIAKRYLLPRQIRENGLQEDTLVLGDAVLKLIIEEYTAEAGVRNLEREIGTVCRKAARKMAEGHKGRIRIDRSNLSKYLGISKFQPEMDKDENQVGLATGLAWTSVGGEVLYIEASLLPGKGELIITGQIGEVMQESARAALTYIKANLGHMGKDAHYLDDFDIHIHVPAGAIPKDGPSAGVAMITALASTITGKPVNQDIAMTGEVTLRGRVLPIGGLKEKALGALRGGVKTILIPEKNRKDLAEVPTSLKRKMAFIAVKDVADVLKTAIAEDILSATPPKPREAKPRKKKAEA
ncbi:endopeptidase La [Desulfobotulus sp.]|jgi:ATP-dependent Lon protease|uniref:endopeptidase La n=1 Tax=Desulfobotulus sp. TaxID=1940337 RepID=UPI002A36892A|nr:endopeptidase La [Desulfobotulus sp.]MDY0161841.1 endopeptidase La [Desulfobotulus sp.]